MTTGFYVPQEHSYRAKRLSHRHKRLITQVNGVARVSYMAKAKLLNQMTQSIAAGNTETFKQSLESAMLVFSREARVSEVQIKSLRRAISAIQLDQSKDDTKMLTTGDVSKKLGVSKQAVINWIETGKIKAYQTPGGHYRIPADQFRTSEEQDATSEAIFERLWAKRADMPPIDEDDLGDS